MGIAEALVSAGVVALVASGIWNTWGSRAAACLILVIVNGPWIIERWLT